MLTAHYYASRKVRHLVIRQDAQNGEPVETLEVSGKVEARRIAAERGATPWNF